jgi:hypothetical protein
MAIGFLLLLAGAVLPFLMVIRILPSTLLLGFVSFGCSVAGLFLGVIGAAWMYAERKRHRDFEA